MKKYLPIGSVVSLKETEKMLMIIGLAQQEAQTEKVWDYSGVFHPEGMMTSANMHLFNADEIQTLHFVGFQNQACINFLDEISKLVDSQ